MTDNQSSGFWDIVQRSHLTRALALYLGGSFAGLQTIDIFTDQLGLPDWVFPGSLILMVLGLPIVVATALVQDRSARERGDAGAISSAAASDDVEGEAESSRRRGPLLTWKRALIGGALAVVLWGLVVAGYMAMRHLGIGPVGSLVAAGVIEERGRVILSDFENNTSDPLLGRAATEAFRIDLSQSTVVTVADPVYVAQVLQRMEGDPNAALNVAMAREVAIREGMAAVVGGEITPVGTGFVLAARLIAAEDGQVLAAYRETASDSTEIIGAIDHLSKKLREKIGESLKTIRANEPLDRVTTPSLDALRKYSQALRVIEQGEHERGITLLEEAVQHDTAFAMAYRKLGVTLMNIGRDRPRAVEALTRAFDHRDRLTERERYLAMGSYYTGVTGEEDKAIAAYRSLLDVHARDTWALNNLAILYLDVRDYARAEELLARSIGIDSASAINYSNILVAQVAQGKFEAAQQTLERFAHHFPGHPSISLGASSLASVQFDYAAAERHLLDLRERQRTSEFWSLATSFTLAAVDEVRGRLAEAERHIEEGVALAAQQGRDAQALAGLIRLALHSAMLRGDPERGTLRMEEALRRFPLDSMPAAERPYALLAIFYSYVGQPQRARAYIAAYERGIDPQFSDPETMAQLDVARGTLAMAEARYADAREALSRADRESCPICVLPLVGQVLDLEGKADSVIAVYERYVTTPWIERLASTDWWALAGILERLAGLYELRGESDKAAHYYKRFVELWENADPALQPRVDAARRALERLTAERSVTS